MFNLFKKREVINNLPKAKISGFSQKEKSNKIKLEDVVTLHKHLYQYKKRVDFIGHDNDYIKHNKSFNYNFENTINKQKKYVLSAFKHKEISLFINIFIIFTTTNLICLEATTRNFKNKEDDSLYSKRIFVKKTDYESFFKKNKLDKYLWKKINNLTFDNYIEFKKLYDLFFKDINNGTI